MATLENVNSIDDFVRIISQLNGKNQKEFYLKVKEKVSSFLLKNSKDFVEDMVKVISAVSEA